MFQETIQDLLAITEAGPGAEDLCDRVRARISAFEPFDSGELLAQTEQGLSRFVLAPGLGGIGEKALAALGDEPTLRVDTAAELFERGLAAGPGLASLLILRLEAPGVASAALVLGHARAWSFAAAPLSRMRTIAGVALRLLVRGPGRGQISEEEVAKLVADAARLRARISSLEAEIVSLRVDRVKPDPGTPQ